MFYTNHILNKNQEISKQINKTITTVDEKLEDIDEMIIAIEDLNDDWENM